MIKGARERSALHAGAMPSAGSRLPYAVELWDLPRVKPERVLGRAGTVAMGRVVFAAAVREHPGRQIVLRRGQRILQTSN